MSDSSSDTDFIEVEFDALFNALSVAKTALDEKELLSSLNSFVFHEGHIITYDDRMSVMTPSPMPKSFSGVVNGKSLFTFLKKLGTKTIKVSIKEDSFIIKSGRMKASFKCHDKKEWIPLDLITEDKEWYDLPKGFVEALMGTYPYCSQDVSMTAVQCVHLNGNVVEVTDLARIVRYTLKESMDEAFKDVLIPGASVKKVVECGIAKMAINKDRSWLYFMLGDGTQIGCRLVVREFPKCDIILDRISKCTAARIDGGEGIRDVFERAEVFESIRHLMDQRVHVIVEKGSLTVRAYTETGQYEEDFPVDYEGDPFEFIANPRFLRQGLQKDTKFEFFSEEKSSSVRMVMFSNESDIGEWRYVAAVMNPPSKEASSYTE